MLVLEGIGKMVFEGILCIGGYSWLVVAGYWLVGGWSSIGWCG